MLDIIATSTSGLETVVYNELKRLGYSPRNSEFEVGRTYFQGDFPDLVRANLWLRSAGKILVRLAEFEVTNDFDVVFDAVRNIEWENWAPRNAAFLVEGRSVRSTITSAPALQRTVKKAIVDRLCRVWKLNSLPETGPLYNVEISLLKDKASITLNSSGRGLHRRGYRLMNVAAPLRETLAAALVQLSVWRRDRPLIDPFCASGTIPIEAAMIARNIAPGLNRGFAAQDWPVIPAQIWADAKEEARAAILPPLEEKIHGSDIDEEALKLARRHAELAGVDEDVAFFRRDFHDLTDSREYGCVIGNPPYGDRIGEERALRELYESIPAVFSKLPTWSFFILTNWLDYEKIIGQSATRRRKLYNSRIECVYYQFLGPKPPKNRDVQKDESLKTSADPPTIDDALPEAPKLESNDSQTPPRSKPADLNEKSSEQTPVFAALDDYADRQAVEFGRRLVNRARHLRRYPARGIDCYRLYDKDIPEVPLAIDVFEGKWLHIAEYERPDDRSVGQHRLWLDKMVATASQILEIPPENVFLKRRSRQKGGSQYERLGETSRIVHVHEGGLEFLCNMTDYLDVGLFLDHRQTRDMARREALDKRFLNLFCYSGAFTCYAADGGAESTTSVDLSPTYLDWCKANLAINGLSNSSRVHTSDGVAERLCLHRFIKSDVVRFLKAIPPASDRNPDIVKLVVETAADFSAGEKARRQARQGSRKKYWRRDREGQTRNPTLPEGAFDIVESNYDLCVCDPPTYSNSKSSEDDWDVQRRHVELLRILATRMKPGGIVYFSNNFRKFKLDEENLVDLYDLREITNRTIPDDFRNKRVHRCWRMIAK